MIQIMLLFQFSRFPHLSLQLVPGYTIEFGVIYSCYIWCHISRLLSLHFIFKIVFSHRDRKEGNRGSTNTCKSCYTAGSSLSYGLWHVKVKVKLCNMLKLSNIHQRLSVSISNKEQLVVLLIFAAETMPVTGCTDTELETYLIYPVGKPMLGQYQLFQRGPEVVLPQC